MQLLGEATSGRGEGQERPGGFLAVRIWRLPPGWLRPVKTAAIRPDADVPTRLPRSLSTTRFARSLSFTPPACPPWRGPYQPVPVVQKARVAVGMGVLSLHRLETRDRTGSSRKQGAIALNRLAGLRQTAGPAERCDERRIRLPKGRIDRDRTPGPFDRLFVLFEPEMRRRFARIPVVRRRIVRTEPDGLVEILEALFKLPELPIVVADLGVSVDGGRVEVQRALGLRVGFLETPLVPEHLGLEDMSVGDVRVDGERFRYQFVAPLEVGLRIGAEVVRDRLPVLDRQNDQRDDVVGVGGERPLAETEARLRLLADGFRGFSHGRETLESQILSVGIGRGRALQARDGGRGELNFQRMSQARDDLVLHLQHVGARGVELIGPEMRPAAGVDELDVDPHLGGARLQR